MDNLRNEALGMAKKGYRYLYFVENRREFKTGHFFAKTAEDVGPMLRDWPDYTMSSVWDLSKLFTKEEIA